MTIFVDPICHRRLSQCDATRRNLCPVSSTPKNGSLSRDYLILFAMISSGADLLFFFFLD